MAQQRRHQLGPVRNFEVAHLEIDNLYRIVRNLKANTIDAGGTARSWDTVEWTRQIPMGVVGGVAQSWLRGNTGSILSAVADASPATIRQTYATHVPTSMKNGAPITLHWVFRNTGNETGTKDVEWRLQYNSTGPSGLLADQETISLTTTLQENQPAQTLTEVSVEINNVVGGDALTMTISMDDGGTTAVNNMVVIDLPWIELTQAGIPDTGSAS